MDTGNAHPGRAAPASITGCVIMGNVMAGILWISNYSHSGLNCCKDIDDLTTWWSQSGAGSFTVDSNAKTVVVEYQPGEQAITQLGCCFFMGLMQEYISWLASGKFFPAREIQCINSDSQRHIFEVNKTPLD